MNKILSLSVVAFALVATAASAQDPTPATTLPAVTPATNFVFLAPLALAPAAFAVVAAGGGATNSTTSTTN